MPAVTMRSGLKMVLIVLVVVVLVLTARAAAFGDTMIKPGAIVAGIRPEMFPGIVVARQVYAEHGFEFWLTSGIEGIHGVPSLHPLGLAADFRVADPDGKWSIPKAERVAMRDEIQTRTRAINPFYQVLLKSDHIHMEYDDGITKNTNIFA